MTYLTASSFHSARQIDLTPMKITAWKKVGGTTTILCPAWKVDQWKLKLAEISELVIRYTVEPM